jgi:hypothetical protein
MKKITKKQYEEYLNWLCIPSDDLKSNGGRIQDHAKLGTWTRKNDTIAFEVGYNEYK